MNSRLMNRDGKLYIVNEYASSKNGIINIYWYPTGVKTKDYFDEFPNEGYKSENWNDIYRVDTGAPGCFKIRLTNGGETKPEFTEKRYVPPPKVRKGVELSWDSIHGRWMKSSKSTKWQWVIA